MREVYKESSFVFRGVESYPKTGVAKDNDLVCTGKVTFGEGIGIVVGLKVCIGKKTQQIRFIPRIMMIVQNKSGPM
jgi:hypothetical protein